MKKIILSLMLALITPVLAAQAATLTSTYYNKLNFNEAKEIQPIEIHAEADGEIMASKGISIILDPEKYILWDAVDSVVFEGPAVTGGYVAAEAVPEYRNGYKTVYIPIKQDWPAGMSATLIGLRLRAYNRLIGLNYFFGYDLTGDGVADVQDTNSYMVTDENIHTDQTPPYLPSGIQYQIAANKASIALTWQNPPDYDLVGVTILKFLTRGGVTSPEKSLDTDSFEEKITDTDVMVGDKITYKLFSRDPRNHSDFAVVNVEVTAATQPPADVTPPAIPPATEIDSLNSLYISYKVRYSIKCHPAGRIVPENDSACLWAKIDLVYAQEKLGENEVSVSLSAHDKELMALRQKWPEARYQAACVDAATPADNCGALGKAIQRVQYFIAR